MICGIVVKWKVAGEHGVKNDATGPNVDFPADILCIRNNQFGRSVAGGAATGSHEVVDGAVGGDFERVGKAKISDDNVFMFV